MLVVAALGGNALLKRGQALTMENQRANVVIAARAMAAILDGGHRLVITHGNGPQVGLLALQAEAWAPDDPAPLDVLNAETEGMIGYMIELELAALLPPERKLATLLTMMEVDADDPAFANPTKPIGPLYNEADARRLEAERGWALAQDGDHWRRVVASPAPLRVLEAAVIGDLVERDTVVICAGGGGIPTARDENGRLKGVDAVIDKDRASALLARSLGADALLLLTDVDAVYRDFGKAGAQAIGETTPEEMRALSLPPGSMGPKVEAACDFAEASGASAAIGVLADASALLEGRTGTLIRQPLSKL